MSRHDPLFWETAWIFLGVARITQDQDSATYRPRPGGWHFESNVLASGCFQASRVVSCLVPCTWVYCILEADDSRLICQTEYPAVMTLRSWSCSGRVGNLARMAVTGTASCLAITRHAYQSQLGGDYGGRQAGCHDCSKVAMDGFKLGVGHDHCG